MKKTFLSLWLCASAMAALHADGTIQTLVGINLGSTFSAHQPIGNPIGMVSDAVGNLYYADSDNSAIRRIAAGTGTVTTVAGTGQPGYSGDGGPASQAALNGPTGLAYYIGGSQEVLLFSDAGNFVVREIDLKTGVISTAAGDGIQGSIPASGPAPGDGGPATSASLLGPGAISVLSQSGYLQVYFVDAKTRVRTFTLGQGTISTYAGGGSTTPASGVAATSAKFRNFIPQGLGLDTLAVDTNYNLYLGYGTTLYEITYAGSYLSPVAGAGAASPIADGGAATDTAIGSVDGIGLDASSNIYFSTRFSVGVLHPTYYASIQRVDAATNIITDVAGSVSVPAAYTGDNGPATSAGLALPSTVALDGSGNLYLVDSRQIREVAASNQVISTIAGNALIVPSAGTPVVGNQFQIPYAAIGPCWAPTPTDLLMATTNNNSTGGSQIFQYHSANGQLSLFAGTGAPTALGDGGPATSASFIQIGGMARDASGGIYVADVQAADIRRIDPATGNVTVVAGVSQSPGYGGDGFQALSPNVQLGNFGGLAFGQGMLYVSDLDSNSIRVINTGSGIISLAAGAGAARTAGFVDGSATAQALFNRPSGMAVDSAGNLFVADTGNNAVRKVAFGTVPMVSTLCGLGPSQGGYRGDGGLAVQAALNGPQSLWLDTAGNIYVADTQNERIRRIDAVSHLVSTVVGDGYLGYSGDGGPALLCHLNQPYDGLADASGDLFINDSSNFAMREVTYYHTPTPTPVSQGYGKPVAYPSPANDHLCFSYYAKGPGHVSIQVYNLGLQLAGRFDDTVAGAGAQVTCGDTSRFATGAYLYRLTLPDGSTDSGKFKVIH
jgi:hypothetical protein